jgi:hypothetical protein
VRQEYATSRSFGHASHVFLGWNVPRRGGVAAAAVKRPLPQLGIVWSYIERYTHPDPVHLKSTRTLGHPLPDPASHGSRDRSRTAPNTSRVARAGSPPGVLARAGFLTHAQEAAVPTDVRRGDGSRRSAHMWHTWRAASTPTHEAEATPSAPPTPVLSSGGRGLRRTQPMRRSLCPCDVRCRRPAPRTLEGPVAEGPSGVRRTRYR